MMTGGTRFTEAARKTRSQKELAIRSLALCVNTDAVEIDMDQQGWVWVIRFCAGGFLGSSKPQKKKKKKDKTKFDQVFQLNLERRKISTMVKSRLRESYEQRRENSSLMGKGA